MVEARSNVRNGETPTYKVCFLFIAQRHQILHGIATAFRLARDPAFEVTVMSPSREHLDYARALCRHWGEDRILYRCPRSSLLDLAWTIAGGTIPPKILALAVLAPALAGFDAIAVPERTSLLLRRFGIRAPSLVHVDHGAGDRAVGFERRIAKFDFVLLAGDKHRDRMMRAGLIRPGAHAVVGYPKFEAADAARDPDWTPFAGTRKPVVLYNPHFSHIGSWEATGEAVLRAFAEQDRYHLIVAPHVRLLDRPAVRRRWQATLSRYADLPGIFIDPGSDRSIDMTYTMLADAYLGDVSSQVYEFLRRPRPCVFLNPHRVDWAGDENYSHWQYGPVLDDARSLIAAIDDAFAGHSRFVDRQVAGLEQTFSAGDQPPSQRAADAIGAHVRDRRRRLAGQ